jgi:hypothetical protein
VKRFHVTELQCSLTFYSRLFAARPVRLETGYARWMLDDPPINFASSTRDGRPGVDQLGILAGAAELGLLKERVQAADVALPDEGITACCYARSEKHWVTAPQGVAWEPFHTLESISVFGAQPQQPGAAAAACSAPAGAQPVIFARRSSSCC